MKEYYPNISINTLCGLFGKTRHSYYDYLWRKQDQLVKEDVVLFYIHKIRKDLPKLGTRKLHHMLQPLLASHDIQVGRDYLFNLLSDYKLLVRNRRRKVITTNSRHWMHKYNNLIKGINITRAEQVWVSDITYIRSINGWGYLSLITDAFSKKIMGFGFRRDLSALGCIAALEMALENRLYNESLIHHSDRGSQYCSKNYVDILLENKISISMTEERDPYENAIAERVNGIIKTEFNLHSCHENFENTYKRIAKSIMIYNTMRPHASCDYLTPEQAHKANKPMKKRWKNYNQKQFNPKKPVQAF